MMDALHWLRVLYSNNDLYYIKCKINSSVKVEKQIRDG